MLTKILGSIITSSPALRRSLWRRWYQFLAGGYRQGDWTFMNYGFADVNSPTQTLKLDASDEPNRYSIQLYRRVVGDVDIKGKDVLEVGSGRGGGSAYIARSLQPRSMLGVDFSDKAVNLSKKIHSGPNLNFQQGDAEALPFKDNTFDAVINVESSHCYGSMDQFLSEVYRVLKPGGYFLWTDMRPRGERELVREQFKKAGLEMRQDTNITPNVLLALDKVSAQKRELIGRYVPKFMLPSFEDFAGVPGTRVYESLRAGQVEYCRCALQKPL